MMMKVSGNAYLDTMSMLLTLLPASGSAAMTRCEQNRESHQQHCPQPMFSQEEEEPEFYTEPATKVRSWQRNQSYFSPQTELFHLIDWQLF